MLASLVLPLLLVVAPPQEKDAKPAAAASDKADKSGKSDKADKADKADKEGCGRQVRRDRAGGHEARDQRQRQAAALHRHHRHDAAAQRPGREGSRHLLHCVHRRAPRRARQAAADVLVQRRARLGVGVAAPWRPRPEARADAGRRRDAGAALQARRQPADLARRHRPRVHRPGRHRLQPAREAGARQEVLGPAGRPRVGGRVHPPLPDALRALDLATLPGRRELWHHARRGPVGVPRGPLGHRLQRHRAGVVDPQLPDRALHQGQ